MLRLAVVMDPIGSIHFHKDSTLAMLWEAQARGWTLYYLEQRDLYWEGGTARARRRPLTVYKDAQRWFELGAPQEAYPFYVEHADLDPVHGKDWMDKVVVPSVAERPEWGPRIVKGAWWRSTVNLAFFEALRRELVEGQAAA